MVQAQENYLKLTFVPSDDFRDRTKMRRFKNAYRLLHMTEQYVVEEYDRRGLESKKRGGNCKNIMDYYGKTQLEPKFVSFGILIGA